MDLVWCSETVEVAEGACLQSPADLVQGEKQLDSEVLFAHPVACPFLVHSAYQVMVGAARSLWTLRAAHVGVLAVAYRKEFAKEVEVSGSVCYVCQEVFRLMLYTISLHA